MPTPFAAELACAIDLACEGAELISASTLGPAQVRYKEGDRNNPVTQYDVAVGRHITQGINQRFPSDFVLNEEDEASHSFAVRQHHRRVWCIDPIDGTRSFVGKSDEYAIMVGLAIDGGARLGVLVSPAHRTLWAGVLGDDASHEAFVQRDYRVPSREPLRAAPTRALATSRVVMSGMRGSRLVEELVRQLRIGGQRQRLASVGLKAARIAEGLADIYVSPSNKTHEWDACAPEAVARAAGARVTDLFGKALRYNKETTPTETGLLLTHGPHHNEIAAAIVQIGSRLAPPAVQQAAAQLAFGEAPSKK